jgi:NAD(P)-dependent dehydrogenase (short-subunit alcohol dehydrogenase family)
MKKTFLITGANSGIGKEVALQLAKFGHHVIMICRDEIKGQAALDEIKIASTSNSIDLLVADLSSQAEIQLLAKTVRERYPALHGLVNNAGVVITTRTLSVDGIEMTLATNHLGPFLLINLLLDLLKASAPARIVNVSSAIHKWGVIDLQDLQFETRLYQFMRVYAQSKLLMNLATFELARRLEGSIVTVNCLHPGAVNTHLGSANAKNIALKILDRFIKYFMLSPEKAAKTPVYLAMSPDVEGVTGQYFHQCRSVSASPTSYDKELAEQVWKISHKLVGLSE